MDRVANLSAVRHEPGPKAMCVGVDVGGTWARVAVWTGARRPRTLVVPADRSLQNLASILRVVWRRRRWTRRHVASLVVASRGLWTAGERRGLARPPRGVAGGGHVLFPPPAALVGARGERPGRAPPSWPGTVGRGR